MNAISYLESVEYEHMYRPNPVQGTLIVLRDLIASDFVRSAKRHSRVCNPDYLCTGDGYRWRPIDPVARFS